MREARIRITGSRDDLKFLVADAGATLVHMEVDGMNVDIYVLEEDIEFREKVRVHVTERFIAGIAINVRWKGDMGKLGVYR